jgi:phytol kinase
MPQRKKLHQTWVFRILLFLFIWLMVGFTTGTGVLMGPVRWLAQAGREHGWAAGTEDLLVKSVIVLFVICSFFIALGLARTVSRSPRLHARIGIPALATLFALGSLYLWLNPRFAGSDVKFEQSTNIRFTFGPYPEEANLRRLKDEGYTAVISLLHPAVVPFEPKLQADEEKAAAKVGIEVIHLPMLPWVSENQKVLDSVRTLAEKDNGRYYVHCYLGKDRVNVVKRVVEEVGVEVASSEPSTARKIAKMPAFERGEIVTLDEGIYLAPYPTDEEWLGYILAGEIRHVVSTLDPDNPEDSPWIFKEKRLAERYGLGFDLEPISLSAYDPQAALRTAQRLRTLPRPLLAHGFLAPSFRTEAIIQAYRSGKPSLPPSLLKAPLKRGKVEVIAPNIAVGPRPQGPEFGGYLYQRGVRRFIYLGDATSLQAREDQIIAQETGFAWEASRAKDTTYLFEILASDGPYYLYGPDLSLIREEIKQRFGPAIPESTRFLPEKVREIEKKPEVSETEEIAQRPRGVAGFIIAFFDRALPDLKMIILYSPLLALYAGIAAWFAGWLRVKRNVRAPYTRKVFHFLIFTMAAALQITAGLPAVVLFGILVSLAVIYATIRGSGFAYYEAMARPTDEPHRTLFILIPLASTAAGGVLANLFFTKFAAVGYLIAGWGDAVGEPVGTRWGKHRYRVPSLGKVKATRSLEGSIAIFIVGTIVGLLGFLLLGIPPLTALWVAAVCGLAGAAVEAFSNHGLDNLTVQVAVSALAWLLITQIVL